MTMNEDSTPLEILRYDTLKELAEDLSIEDVESLAEDLIEEMPNLCQEVAAATEREDAGEAHRLAHSLKGTGNIFGLEALIACCQSLESHANEGELVEAAALAKELQSLGQQSIQALREALTKLNS